MGDDDRVLNDLTRSTGVVASVLAVAALLWGFLFSARATGTRLRPAWWLDLHNWLGGLSLVFIGAHVVLSVLDANSGLGPLDALLPGVADRQPFGIGVGVVATYLFAVAVFTTWPRRLRNRKWWRIVHLGSVIGVVLSMVHALQVGSDASTAAFEAGFVAVAGIAVYGLGLRLFGLADWGGGGRSSSGAVDSERTPSEP